MARFGYNQYALVLAALAFAGVGSGCGGGGSSGGGGMAVAGVNSGTASPTTSATPGSTAVLGSIQYVDVDASTTINKGDRLIASFTSPIQAVASPNTIDPATEFSLAVGGDTFGAGATVAATSNPNEVAIVLGDNPILNVSEVFSVAKTTPGSASGVNVSIFATGEIKTPEGRRVVAAAAPIDIAGSLTAGFRPGASLNVARGGHSAVTLDDGRVLVVGGIAAGGGKASTYVGDAELFDPLTNMWTKISDLSGNAGKMMNGSVPVKAALTTATKLNDGTVLICGGVGVEKKGFFGLFGEKVDTLESAFVFDPATNSFSEVGNLNYSRHSHTATLMNDGRVLIAGGYNDSFWRSDKTQAPFEIYDPAKKAFEKSGSLFSRFKSVEARQSHTATAIEGGSGILLAGGNHWEGGGLFGLIKPKLKMNKGSEVVRGVKTERAGDLNAQRLNHGAALVSPTNVLIAGGHDTAGAVGALELYNSATAAWTQAGSLTRPRSNCEVAVNGTSALVIGGYDGTTEVATVEVFDADAKALTQVSYTLATARNGCAVTTLKDGRILVTGGFTGGAKSYDSLDGQALDSCEVFVRQ